MRILRLLLNPTTYMVLLLLVVFFPYWIGILAIAVGIYAIDRWWQWCKRVFLKLDEYGDPL
jgi:hypothetical protein